MNKRTIIATLIEISDDLDSMGMFAEADVLTKCAENFGYGDNNPDAAAAEFGFAGEGDYMRDQNLMNDFNREDALMQTEARINELTNKPHITEEELQELEHLLMTKNNGEPEKPSESSFIDNLESAGADVVAHHAGL